MNYEIDKELNRLERLLHEYETSLRANRDSESEIHKTLFKIIDLLKSILVSQERGESKQVKSNIKVSDLKDIIHKDSVVGIATKKHPKPIIDTWENLYSNLLFPNLKVLEISLVSLYFLIIIEDIED